MQELDEGGKLVSKHLSKRKVTLSRLKRRVLKHLWVVRLSLLGIGFLLILLLFLLFGMVIRKTGLDYYTGLLASFVFTPEDEIEIIDNRTNILVLGKGGAGHEAPELTDTIMFVSINHLNSSVVVISLPRDIWIPSLRAKLNSAYYWGNEKEEGGGLILAKSSVEEIVGEPIAYGLVVDFTGFKETIDVLGGIEVDVEEGFVDERYPIPGLEGDECGGNDPEFTCRYEVIEFEKGVAHMDGGTALKFVRSRNAEGENGSDFARARRQQKVTGAIKDKILSRDVMLSYKKLFALHGVLVDSSETDIDSSALVILARRLMQSKDNMDSRVLPEEFLENPPISSKYDNLYVFIPREDPKDTSGWSWSEVHEWLDCVLKSGDCK
jgi:LCP family protein required for cell wall assembly